MVDRETDIALACAAMKRGGLILYPTDTVWGIGCDATDTEAVSRVYALKQRSDSKALITLLHSIDAVRNICPAISVEEEAAMSGIDGRPTTVILNGVDLLAPNLLAADGSAGVRVTAESFSATLCRTFGRPIVSTSANISGQPAPALFCEISSEIIEGVDYVCNTRRDDTTRALPSIVVRIDNDGSPIFLRK